ncbi:hypothetical protein F4802DRAFT_429916 [Xylaria palmicola]|nr:hypothetical protein F4802DRAFT_429916 [Xylaria palmicola]
MARPPGHQTTGPPDHQTTAPVPSPANGGHWSGPRLWLVWAGRYRAFVPEVTWQCRSGVLCMKLSDVPYIRCSVLGSTRRSGAPLVAVCRRAKPVRAWGGLFLPVPACSCRAPAHFFSPILQRLEPFANPRLIGLVGLVGLVGLIAVPIWTSCTSLSHFLPRTTHNPQPTIQWTVQACAPLANTNSTHVVCHRGPSWTTVDHRGRGRPPNVASQRWDCAATYAVPAASAPARPTAHARPQARLRLGIS